MREIAVIGAGASGMMAAMAAAREGARVTLIDHGDKPGRKLLATGNGRCNYTNRRMDARCYHGNPAAMPVIRRFDAGRTLDYFRELGIWPRERNGYYYPSSDQASCVREALEGELLRLGVRLRLQETVRGIAPPRAGHGRFRIKLAGESCPADAVILATGGMALPASGSDGSGYALAESLGHRVIEPLPALTAIVCQEKFFRKLAGIRLQAGVKLVIEGRAAAEDTGEVQLTAYGISGIPVFQVSRYASRALARGRSVEASLDLAPMLDDRQLREYLRAHSPEQYQGLLNRKLVPVLLERYGRSPEKLAAGIRDFRVRCREVKGFEQAQVTCGGVDCREICLDTMESLRQPGLYLAGELLDVDGICGGYNLQWAWSSGWLAGTSAAAGPREGAQ